MNSLDLYSVEHRNARTESLVTNATSYSTFHYLLLEFLPIQLPSIPDDSASALVDFDVHISLWINSDTRLSRDIVLSLSALLNSDTKTNYKSGNSINGSDRTRKDTQVNSHVFVIDMDKLAAVAESVSNSAEDSGIDVFLYVNLVHRMSGVPIGSGSNCFPCFYQDGNFTQFKPKFGSDNSVPRITVKEFTTHTITVPITANNNIRPFHMNSVLATVLHELMPNAVGQQSDNFYLSCRVSSFPTLSRLKNNDIITAKDTSIEKLLDGPEMKNCSYSRTIQFIDSVNYREVDLLAERVSQYSCISVEDIQLAPDIVELYTSWNILVVGILPNNSIKSAGMGKSFRDQGDGASSIFLGSISNSSSKWTEKVEIVPDCDSLEVQVIIMQAAGNDSSSNLKKSSDRHKKRKGMFTMDSNILCTGILTKENAINVDAQAPTTTVNSEFNSCETDTRVLSTGRYEVLLKTSLLLENEEENFGDQHAATIQHQKRVKRKYEVIVGKLVISVYNHYYPTLVSHINSYKSSLPDSYTMNMDFIIDHVDTITTKKSLVLSEVKTLLQVNQRNLGSESNEYTKIRRRRLHDDPDEVNFNTNHPKYNDNWELSLCDALLLLEYCADKYMYLNTQFQTLKELLDDLKYHSHKNNHINSADTEILLSSIANYQILQSRLLKLIHLLLMILRPVDRLSNSSYHENLNIIMNYILQSANSDSLKTLLIDFAEEWLDSEIVKHIFTADDESVTKMILTRKIKSVDELYLVLLHNHWDYFISGVQCLQLLHHLQQYLNNDSNDNNNENTKKSSTVKDVYSLHFEKLLFSITNYMAMVFENILTSELMQYATAFLEYAEAVVQILYSTADKLLFVLDLIISSISFVDNKALGSLKRLVCSLLAVLERISDYIYPKFHANVGINSLRATAEKSIELIVMITKLLFIVNTAVQKVDIIIGKADKNNNLPFCLRSICTVINSTLQTYPIVAKQVSLSSYYHNNYRVNLVLILAEMIESISILFTSNLPIYRSDVLATHRSDNERAKLLESSSNSVYMHGDEHFNIVEKLSGLKVDRAVSPPWQSPAASISSSPNPVTRRGYGTPQAVLASPTGGSSQQSSPKGATSDQKLSERWNIPVDSQQSKIRKYSGKGALVYVQQNYYYIIILLDLLASLWYVQSTNSGNTRCRLSVRSEGYGISGVKSNERGNHIQHKNSVGSARLLNSIESLLKRIFHSVFRGRENDVDIRLAMCEAMSATKELSAKGLIYCVIAQSKLDSLLCRYHSNISSINYDIDDVHLVKNSLESTNVLLTSKIAQYIAYTSVLYNTLAIEAAEQSSLDAKGKEAGYDDDNKKWISLRSSIYLSLRDLVHSHILGMKAFIKFYVQQLAIVSYSVRKSVVFREFTNLLETSATLLSQLLSLLTNVGLLKYCSNEKNGAQNYFSIVNSVIQSEGIHLLEDLFRLTTAIPSDADLLIPTFKKDIESSSLGFNSFDDELLIPMTNRSSGAKLSNINNRKDTISTSISKSLEHSRWLIFSTIFKIVEINSRSSFDECKSKVLASVDEKMFNAITVDDSTAIESVLKFPITNYLHDAKSDILFSNEMCVRHSLLGDGFGKSEEFDYSLALSEVDSVPTNTSAIVELRVLLKLLAKYFAFTSITDAEGDPFYNKSDSENNSNSNNNYRRLLESIRSNIYHHIFDVKMSLTAKYSLYLAEGSASKCGAHKIASTRFLNKLLLSASLSNLLLFNYCYLTTDNSSDVVTGSKRKELLISRSGALLDELRSIICMENNMFELGSYVHGDIEYASDKKEEAAKLLEKLLRKLGYSFKFGHAIFRLILQTLLHSNQVATNSIGNPYLSPTVESSQFGSPNSGLGSPARTKEPIIQAMRDILAQLLISGNWEKGIYFTNLFIKRFQRDNNHVSFAANNIGSTINTYMFDSPTNKSTSNFGYMNNNFAEKERFDSITSEFSRIKDLFEEKLKSDGLLRLFPNYYVLRIISSKPFGELNNSCPTGIDNTTTSTINDGNDLQDYITSKFSALLGDISIERYAFVAKTADESDLHLSQSDTSPSNSNCGYEYWLLLKFDMTANASCINFYEEYLMSKKLAIEKLRFVGDRSSNEQDSKPTTETLLSPVSYHIVLSELSMAFPEFTVLPNNFLAEEYLDFDRLASSKFRYENTYKYTANAIQLFEAFPEEICSDVDKQMEHIVENGATSVYQQNYNNTSEIDIATKIPYFPQKMVNKQLSVESITTTASKQRASPTRWLKRMVSSKSNCQMDDESNSLNAQILVDEAAERNRQLEQEARELKGKQAQELAVKNETYNNLDNHYFLNSLRNVNRKFYVYCMLNDESMQQEFDNLKKNNQRSSTNGDNSKYSVSAKVFHRYTVSLFEMNNINCKPFLMEDSAYDLPKSELGADSGNNGCKNDDPSSYCSISSLSMSPITFVDLFNESRLTTVQATLEVMFHYKILLTRSLRAMKQVLSFTPTEFQNQSPDHVTNSESVFIGVYTLLSNLLMEPYTSCVGIHNLESIIVSEKERLEMEWQSYRKKAKKEYLKDVAKYDEHIEKLNKNLNDFAPQAPAEPNLKLLRDKFNANENYDDIYRLSKLKSEVQEYIQEILKLMREYTTKFYATKVKEELTMEGVREQAMRKGRRPTIANSTQMFELRKRTASNNFINGDFDSDGEQEQKDNNNSSGNMNKPEVPKDNDYTMRLKMCLFLESLYSAVEIGVSL